MSIPEFDETAKNFMGKLKTELKRRKNESASSEFNNEIIADQAKRYEEWHKLHKEHQAQTQRDGMSGYGSYELTMLAFLDYLTKKNIEWKKSPRYEITIQILAGFNWASAQVEEVNEKISEFMGVEEKVGIEYSIDIKDGVPSFMVTSEGNKINSDLEAEFNKLITFALDTDGYKQDQADGKFKDKITNAVLTQEKFDNVVAPNFKQKLEQILEVGDLRASPSLRP